MPVISGDRWTRVLLLLIFGFAAFLRLHDLSKLPPALGMDEAMNGSNALENIEKSQIQIFYPENFGREGLFINIQTLSVYLFGNTPLALRLPAALFGIITVLGVYALGAVLLGKPAGLWAAFFLATSFWHVNFSRIGLRVICAPCFLAWGLYLLLLANQKLRQEEPALRLMLAAGIVYGLGFYTYISYRDTPLLILAIFVYEFARARKSTVSAEFSRAWGTFTVATAVVLLPLVLYFINHPAAFWGRIADLSILNKPHPIAALTSNITKTTLMFFTAGDQNMQHNFPGRPQLFVPVAVCFFVGLTLVAAALVKRSSSSWFSYAVALGALMLAGIPVLLTNEGIPDALRSVPMVTGVFVLAGAGANYLYDFLRGRIPSRIGAVILILLIAGLAYEPYHTYFDRWGVDPSLPLHFDSKIFEYARQINALPAEFPKYVVDTTGGEMVHGIPVSAQPVMFLTNTYTTQGQTARNVHYITPNESGTPAPGMADADYCRQVAASLKQGAVYCLLR